MHALTAQLAFFRGRQAAYCQLLDAAEGNAQTITTLLTQAFNDFNQQAEQQCQGQPTLACHKGCATCCSIRVTATAPEVLLVARHLREQSSAELCRRLLLRLLEADDLTRDLDEAERVKLRLRCPFIEKRACVIYPVRPLACRGHASYSRQACIQAAAGRRHSVPYSISHHTSRALVQNALQSALRDAGLAWASYELNHALRLALADAESETAWLAGEDVFAEAQVVEVSAEEMAAGFDQLKA